jgi:anti-sigma B factor antagonist
VDDFRTECQTLGDWTVLSVVGEVDAYTAAALQEAVTAQIVNGISLVLDLSAVEFIDSTGLRVLVETLRAVREAEGQLKLVSENDQTLKLLRITALDSVFDVHPNVAVATS